ncbi:hypothetical protein [Yoonia sp.]|uniref:hypothetical protein n=1 Tax=Yoonia sp. TaxID=2212373 RepID=UPI002FDA1251
MRWFGRALALLLVMSLAACNPYGWNQKLTVVIQTPDGVVTGSSVTQVTKIVSDGPFTLPQARGVQSELAGEAVVVEVLPGKYLFVLLKGVDNLAFRAFEDVIPYRRGSEFARWARQIARHREPGIVPPANYPMMVMFEDISDPTSVRLVAPDDLVSAFGEGVRLQEMTLMITDEVSEQTIRLVLEWLSESPEAPIIGDVDPFDFSVAATLRVGDFIRG